MIPSTSTAALAPCPPAPRLASEGRSAVHALCALSAALTLTACGGGSSGSTAPLASKPLAEACAAYTTAALPHGAKITRTEVRKAEGSLPEVCIVRGQIVSSPDSTIQWAVELPTLSLWNGKTLTIGGGGSMASSRPTTRGTSNWWGRRPTRT